MEITFTKMVGNGNDFIVVDNRSGALSAEVYSAFARICQRKTSVGADGVLLMEKDPELPFSMRYFNSDGSEAEMCGNGARCIALYAHSKGIAPREMSFSSRAGVHTASVSANWIRLKFTDPGEVRLDVPLVLNAERLVCHFLNSGVPHLVLFVENLPTLKVTEFGRGLRFHPELGPEGANVNFVQVIGDTSIKIRTYERGVEDETLSCGTGAVASAIVSHLKGKVQPPVEVSTQGGLLRVDFQPLGGQVTEVYLEGEARIAYEGKIELGSRE